MLQPRKISSTSNRKRNLRDLSKTAENTFATNEENTWIFRLVFRRFHASSIKLAQQEQTLWMTVTVTRMAESPPCLFFMRLKRVSLPAFFWQEQRRLTDFSCIFNILIKYMSFKISVLSSSLPFSEFWCAGKRWIVFDSQPRKQWIQYKSVSNYLQKVI